MHTDSYCAYENIVVLSVQLWNEIITPWSFDIYTHRDCKGGLVVLYFTLTRQHLYLFYLQSLIKNGFIVHLVLLMKTP